MMPEPEYAQEIIVGIIFRTTFAWYVTYKDYWYLDMTIYNRALIASGYKHAEPEDYSFRFQIGIVNEKTAESFLAAIADKRVTAQVLSHMMVTRRQMSVQDDLLDFAPCLLVDFDHRRLFSQYPEMIRFERYVPEGWSGVYQDFTSTVPAEARYWIVNGQNLFQEG